jgi:hypothetical protein
MLLFVETTLEVEDEEEIPKLIKRLKREYGDKYHFDSIKKGIRVRARKGEELDWFDLGRMRGIIKGDERYYCWSECFHVPSDFDQKIIEALRQRFGEKYKVVRAEKPPTEFGRGTWAFQPGTKLFVTGDFKSYDEVVEVMNVVKEAILEKVREGVKLIILFAPGQKGVAEYVASKIKSSLHLEPELKLYSSETP